MWNWGPHGTLVKVIREHSQMVPLAENISLKVDKWKRCFQPHPDLSEGSRFFCYWNTWLHGKCLGHGGQPQGGASYSSGAQGSWQRLSASWRRGLVHGRICFELLSRRHLEPQIFYWSKCDYPLPSSIFLPHYQWSKGDSWRPIVGEIRGTPLLLSLCLLGSSQLWLLSMYILHIFCRPSVHKDSSLTYTAQHWSCQEYKILFRWRLNKSPPSADPSLKDRQDWEHPISYQSCS